MMSISKVTNNLHIRLILVELNCERQGSYTKIPLYFPYAKNPFNSKNVLYKDILNRTWVSVPSGSETNFTVGARNTYEVNMFIVKNSILILILIG